MKALALALLLLAALIYAVATFLEPRHVAWSYVAAAAEAAMIGALADWFAVVALFRHPLGLPIPHTAIIAANKDQLGNQLARFLSEHFLTPEQVRRVLTGQDLAGTLGRWLAQPASAQRVGQWVQAAMPALLDAIDQAPARAWVSRLGERILREANLASLGGQALGALTAHGHHQQWLDALLRQFAAWAEQDAVQERFTDAIALELKQLRYVGLDQMAARLATRKLVSALTRTLSDVSANPEHELRHRFDEWMREAIARMQSDPQWQARVGQWRDAWIEQPGWSAPVEAWWSDFVAGLRAQAVQPGGALAERVAAVVQTGGHQLAEDERLREWVNQQIQSAVLHLLAHSRGAVSAFVAQRVAAWDADDMSHVLERHIGRDLQFIRINGTLVGALVGLGLHAITQGVLALPLVQSLR
jgi:uncharacterized membrane-anchored protein YjiN (DUF445 family)